MGTPQWAIRGVTKWILAAMSFKCAECGAEADERAEEDDGELMVAVFCPHCVVPPSAVDARGVPAYGLASPPAALDLAAEVVHVADRAAGACC